jgi:hypothetical protein
LLRRTLDDAVSQANRERLLGEAIAIGRGPRFGMERNPARV